MSLKDSFAKLRRDAETNFGGQSVNPLSDRADLEALADAKRGRQDSQPTEPHRTADSLDEATDLGNRSKVQPIDAFAELAPGGKFGNYEILAELGRGGMGVVYKARQITLNRTVALKMILAGGCASKAQRLRFRAEAEAIATVEHPSIVPIYDVGEIGGRPYFAMAFVSGRSLAEALRAGPLEPITAARILLQIANAVGHAHANGIIHRDIKPANILLEETVDRRPGNSTRASHWAVAPNVVAKLTDFGLAKRLEESEGLTRTGQVVGTPSFMPPEQAQGQSRLLGPETDVYAIGATLYACLTGRAPFESTSTKGLLHAIATREPPPPSRFAASIDRDLETICLKCLDPDPMSRYPTANTLAADIDRWLAGEPIGARRRTFLERCSRWYKHHWLLLAGLFGPLFFTAFGFCMAVYLAPKRPSPPDPPVERRDPAARPPRGDFEQDWPPPELDRRRPPPQGEFDDLDGRPMPRRRPFPQERGLPKREPPPKRD